MTAASAFAKRRSPGASLSVLSLAADVAVAVSMVVTFLQVGRIIQK